MLGVLIVLGGEEAQEQPSVIGRLGSGEGERPAGQVRRQRTDHLRPCRRMQGQPAGEGGKVGDLIEGRGVEVVAEQFDRAGQSRPSPAP
ncbi:hypothetical protein [Nonomuraea jabiensis]|uniref:Uncharacterized protein n=1 Tax=Nonomuraea jabiensis TaxID=882448 RepID=A0A7W9GEA9_9ACTN|nr:hypothetical protein [Nonomuraea jabiensis]MBB5782137.1 hypothetical protein [Nonomuraea jabiensis]